MIDPQLAGKVVLVTGANHGIGAATARTFAEQKARVFLACYRNPSKYTPEQLNAARAAGIGGPLLYEARQQEPPGPLVEEIVKNGGTAVCLEIDLANPANIPKLFDRCEQELGEVDVLVNNHTYCVLDTFDPARETNEGFAVHLTNSENIDASFAINSRAYALMMTEYIQRFLKRDGSRGRIINLSTDAAHAHEANISYAASKHAIESYSRSAAMEVGKYGITVNIVAPGPIQTGYLTPDEEAAISAQTPMRRIGHPQDVADAIVFLASEQAHWLTGQLLYVGGGWRMHQ